MSKLTKMLLVTAYSYLIIQYFKMSRHSTEHVLLDYMTRSPVNVKGLKARHKKIGKNITALKLDYEKPVRFATDFKYILKYTNSFLHYDTSLYKNGQHAFIENKCKYYNCYITNDRNLLLDMRHYDAILFDVENGWDGSLILREPYQKFIFMASESSANYPLCDHFYNNYYNLTWTYKLDSDIRWTYLTISDNQGNIVGPNVSMNWIDKMKPTPDHVKTKLIRKKKAAAWFVSNCKTKNSRGEVTKAIAKELKKYGHVIVIFGWCGNLQCPKDRFPECLELLETDYYFYLSFENSFSEDYVTEKILYPLLHYTVPIVYGGANYSRFLPPDSYIDARQLNASQVAYEMNKAINDRSVYENYFRWHNHYKYIKTTKLPEVCKLCQILNEEAHKRSSYKDFLKWWNPDYVRTCNHGEGRVLIKTGHNGVELEAQELNNNLIFE